MDLFDVLTMLGGLCLFLFGMNIMGQALERRAGNGLRALLGKLTTNKFAGLLTGIGVTAVIQSSSATTVMVVGFVNSGLMSLKQSINVIMGANIGTTVTAWILSLSGISSDNVFIQLLKPTSFTPILALLGIIFYMFLKNDKKKDTGLILLGFATLMFGMDTMSGAVKGLADVPEFRQLFLLFQNPFLGMLAGAVLTAVIQSSSASVGILQALAVTGDVTYGAAIPIIMGQNIGTCITALLSSVGANKNAKRSALVHLSFNVIGTTVWLAAFALVQSLVKPALFNESASLAGIAVAHSLFNLLCTLLLLPLSGALEKLVIKLIPDDKTPVKFAELDERLLNTPPIALASCRKLAKEMAESVVLSMKNSLMALYKYTPELADEIRSSEEAADHYEDVLGSYLVKLSTMQISEQDSRECAMLLKAIGDFERISDHSVNVLESVEELRKKQLNFSDAAKKELKVMTDAVKEILDISLMAFTTSSAEEAFNVEPLEQIIDELKKKLRSRHIFRLQQGECSIEVGFVWSDLLTNLERTSDHCSNIAGEIVDNELRTMNIHESVRAIKQDSEKYRSLYKKYAAKYSV